MIVWLGSNHSIHEVFKNSFCHFMSIEPISILVYIWLKVSNRMMHTS